jgi:hypothetical protein
MGIPVLLLLLVMVVMMMMMLLLRLLQARQLGQDIQLLISIHPIPLLLLLPGLLAVAACRLILPLANILWVPPPPAWFSSQQLCQPLAPSQQVAEQIHVV